MAALLGAADAVENSAELAFVEVSPWRTMAEGDDPVTGSIAGAHLADVRVHFAGTPTDMSGHLPLPRLHTVRATAARWAGPEKRPLVLYTRRIEEFTSATRAWFVLAAAGIQGVSILDGGLPAWVQQGGELGAPSVPAPVADEAAQAPGDTSAQQPESSQVRVLRTPEVEDVARLGTLLDARPEEAYHGLVGQPRTGHVPGALHAAIPDLLNPDGTVRSRSDLRRWFLAHHAFGHHEVAAYCNGGIASSAIVFTGALIGQPVALYVDSWSAWKKDPNLPVEQTAPRTRPCGHVFDCIEDTHAPLSKP